MLRDGTTMKNVMFTIVCIPSCGQRAILCIVTFPVLLSYLCVCIPTPRYSHSKVTFMTTVILLKAY